MGKMALNLKHYKEAARALDSGALREAFAGQAQSGGPLPPQETAQRGAVQELTGGASTVAGLIAPGSIAGLLNEREKKEEEEKKDRMRRLLEDAYRAL